MADVTLRTQSAPTPGPEHFRSSVDDTGISIDEGMATGIGTEGPDTVAFALSSASATAPLIGLATSAAEAPGQVNVRFAGPVTLTTEQWDAVTGQSGGLTPKALYYQDPSSAGKLTTVRPVSNINFTVMAGLALSRTTMLVRPGVPYHAV